MKLFVKMQVALAQLKNKKGQNTVEYLLMLGVIVGVVAIVGVLIKNMVGEGGSVSDAIKEKVLGGIGNM